MTSCIWPVNLEMMFGIGHQHRDRIAFLEALYDSADLSLTRSKRVPGWSRLSDDDKSIMRDIALDLAITKEWQPSNGFSISDEMILAIADQAALVAIGLDELCFAQVREIIVWPSTTHYRMYDPNGKWDWVPSMRFQDKSALGHTSLDGVVYLAWDAIDVDVADNKAHTYVVIHEFAHQLDFRYGLSSSIPRLRDEALRDQWVQVFASTMKLVANGEAPQWLQLPSEAGADEVFAYASEAFFGNAVTFKNEAADLYAAFAAFYGQQTA